MLKASTFLLSKEKGENWGKTQPTKKADIAKAKILHHSYNSASHKWDYFDTTCNIWQRAFHRHRLEFIRVETAGPIRKSQNAKKPVSWTFKAGAKFGNCRMSKFNHHSGKLKMKPDWCSWISRKMQRAAVSACETMNAAVQTLFFVRLENWKFAM